MAVPAEVMAVAVLTIHSAQALVAKVIMAARGQEMLLAVKFLRKIAAQEPISSLIAEELRPGPAVQEDEDLIADFRARSGTVYHPSCTARMGPDPASSVVDSDLRVHGVSGLRVCDASVFPTLIGGNTNAPSILVGWMGAERILASI